METKANDDETQGYWIDAMLRPGSEADRRYREWATSGAQLRKSKARAAAVIGPNDLVRHGGRIVPQSIFRNVFLGGSEKWKDADVTQIDDSIALAMRDRRLENVLRQ